MIHDLFSLHKQTGMWYIVYFHFINRYVVHDLFSQTNKYVMSLLYYYTIMLIGLFHITNGYLVCVLSNYLAIKHICNKIAYFHTYFVTSAVD